ncbi:MAG TPA: hypothetical protein VFN19_00635 [Candidatus Nanopelagicales bacterium]|nr:hypothetical protein [Candidatus Nanopelagicales bacterium]
MAGGVRSDGPPVERAGGGQPFRVPDPVGRWPQQWCGEHDRLRLVLSGTAHLRQCAAASAGRTSVTRLTVRLRDWWPPTVAWSGRIGPVRGLLEHRVQFRPRARTLTISLRLSTPCDLGELLLAVAGAADPYRPATSTGAAQLAIAVPTTATAGPLLAWGPELIGPDEHLDEQLRRTDVLLDVGAETAASTVQAASVAAASLLRSPLVDVTVCNPRGRRPHGPATYASLVRVGERWQVVSEDGTAVCELTESLREPDVRALRAVDVCRVPAGDPGAQLLLQLSACGVVVSVPPGGQLPDGVAPVLQELWRQEPPAAQDRLGLVVASVRQSREALRRHGSAARRDQVTALVGQPDQPVSVLLMTRRPAQARGVLSQLAASSYPELQVVVGVHGDAGQEAGVAAVAAEVGLTQVEVHNVAAALPFGAGLAQLSARADGELLTKVDDDDYYGPEHVADLVLARQHSAAQLVGKPLSFVHLQDQDRTLWRDTGTVEGYASFVAGGTILISAADLRAVGGWRPVPRSVDRALLQRVLRAGALVYSLHGLGYVYVRHGSGHTWEAGSDRFLDAPLHQQWDGLLRHRELGTDQVARR